MKTEIVLVDTGPLVALFRESDEHHKACTAEFADFRRGLPTTWPVLAEAFYLLRHDNEAIKKLVQFLEDGLLIVRELGADFPSWLRVFFGRYSNLEPQLADATLMYLAEREGIDTVFTLDRRDFSVYRTSGGKALRIVPQG